MIYCKFSTIQIFLSPPERRDLASSHLHLISKEMIGEEAFQLHVAIPPMYTSFLCTRSLFLLVVFFAGALRFPTLILLCQLNNGH